MWSIRIAGWSIQQASQSPVGWTHRRIDRQIILGSREKIDTVFADPTIIKRTLGSRREKKTRASAVLHSDRMNSLEDWIKIKRTFLLFREVTPLFREIWLIGWRDFRSPTRVGRLTQSSFSHRNHSTIRRAPPDLIYGPRDEGTEILTSFKRFVSQFS